MIPTPYPGERAATDAQRQLTLEYFDAAKAHDTMAELCCAHELKVADPKAVHFRHSRFMLASVLLSRIEYGTDARVEYPDLSDYYTISLPFSGTQELRQGQRVAFSDSGHGIIISPTQPVYLEMSGDCKKRLVQISRAALERQLAALLGRQISEPLVFEPGMAAADGPGASWWRTIRHLEMEQGFKQSLYIAGPLLGQVEQMLISGLLYGQPHNYSAALRNSGRQVAPAHVRRAEAFIRARAQEPIGTAEIVEAAGVPRRTLYDGFKRFRGTSPMNYLRAVRMEGARQDLLRERGGGNITHIAMKWGFTHLGRFSIDYKKRFGESPSETFKRP